MFSSLKTWINRKNTKAEPDQNLFWEDPFRVLRNKWVEIPTTRSGRKKSTELLQLSDTDLLEEWSACRRDITTADQFSHRGWYHQLYSGAMRGQKLLDVGSGFAVDSITFLQHGADVTFLDLVESNLQVVERLCKILNLRAVKFHHLKNLDSLKLLNNDFDYILAAGSLHHAPYSNIRPEVQELTRHLKIGGRWLQLAYPKTRWIRDGSLPFDQWGELTDGPGTPWAEWYDLSKVLELLKPGEFQVVFWQEFHNHNFIWFDLLYQGSSDR